MSTNYRISRFAGFFLIAILLFTIALVTETTAQNNAPKPVYVAYTYIKTFPGKFDMYDSLLRTYTQKIFNHEVKEGSFYEWSTYEVLMPLGSAAEYDVVGVSVTDKLEMLLDPPGSQKEIFMKTFPDLGEAKMAQIVKDYADSRTIVRKEIYTVNSSTGGDGPPTKTPAKYVQVNYMTPVAGKNADYEKIERVTFKPIHMQRIKLNALKGWVLLQKLLPADTKDQAPYVTVDFYDDFSGMIDGKYEAAIKAAYPTSDINKMFQAVGAVKKDQRTEVWKLMMHSEEQPPASR
jgi:hypothetical protein